MLKVVNNIGKWRDKKQSALDTLLSAMGVDVLRLSKQQVPVAAGGGQLQSSGIIKKDGFLHYKIQFNKEYAAYQHRGSRRDGSRVVRNYTYPGKKSKYLSDPGRTIWNNKKSYIKTYL